MLTNLNPAPSSGSSLRVGFLVWNQFQVAHFAEIAKHFHEPDFIFTDRDVRALDNFNPSWLVPYGAYCRFLTDTSLHTLDCQYDVIVTQHRPPLKARWKHTRLVMYQYSLAKPKTVYNGRWFAADHAMVYGRFSESIIEQMCATSRVGNARFDPYFEGRLDASILQRYKEQLNPGKRTLLYLPTWGDLSTLEKFQPALANLAGDFNLILHRHHLAPLRGDSGSNFAYLKGVSSIGLKGVSSIGQPPSVLDPALYLMSLADLVISDMSGAIFDALYCRKPVVLVGAPGESFDQHHKADDSAIEISRRSEIGPYVDSPDDLEAVVRQISDTKNTYAGDNEKLVAECFAQRGGCAALAARAIELAADGNALQPTLQRYAAPDFANSILSRALAATKKRSAIRRSERQDSILAPRLAATRRLQRISKQTGFLSQVARGLIRLSRYSLRSTAAALSTLSRRDAAASVHMICVREFGDRLSSAVWLAEHHEGKGNDSLAEALYQRAKPLSLAARSQHLRLLLKRRAFYEAGREIETWQSLKQRSRVRTVYQTFNATSALRFSRRRWKTSLGKLFRTTFAPSTCAGTEALRRFGMIRTAEALYRSRNSIVPSDLDRTVTTLGSLADFIDLAAKNETSPPSWQMCVTPGGEVIPTSEVSPESIVEVYLLLSLSRESKHDQHRAYKSSLLTFSQNLVQSLRSLGIIVYPRIQAGIIGATPVSRQFPAAFTWHTVHCGLSHQFHLKIGALYGHFVIDQRGYSGWGSIAEQPLSKLIEDVDVSTAEQHWHSLHNELVLAGKSKYAQAEKEPSDWGRYIFLPMQVLDDTVSQLADINTLDLLKALSEWSTTTSIKVVVKRHPMCRDSEIAQLIDTAQRAGRIIVSDANIHQLIRNAECVVTVNSGVGAEALLHLKPVITTGGSDYAAATRRVRDVSELFAVLNSGDWTTFSEEEIKCFLWCFTKRYMVQCDDLESIRLRLESLLQQTGLRFQPRLPAPVTPATTAVPLVPVENRTAPIHSASSAEGVGLGEQCEALLRELQDQGVTCWLDSGSLLGLVRDGQLNHWEKDIDLGIWVDHLEGARHVCDLMARRFDLHYREKWAREIPYALLLNDNNLPSRMLPIAIHVFYRKGKYAWSIQPHSLVAGHSKYPKYRYREAIGNRKGRGLEKLRFAAKHPKYAMSILAEEFSLNAKIGRRLREIEKEQSLTDKLLTNIFNELFEWTIPARYFEQLKPLDSDNPHILIPAAASEYLRTRYGEWRMPVQDWFYLVDDRCIKLLPAKDRRKTLQDVLAQLPTAATEVNL